MSEPWTSEERWDLFARESGLQHSTNAHVRVIAALGVTEYVAPPGQRTVGLMRQQAMPLIALCKPRCLAEPYFCLKEREMTITTCPSLNTQALTIGQWAIAP
jgi:hypothetical protein